MSDDERPEADSQHETAAGSTPGTVGESRPSTGAASGAESGAESGRSTGAGSEAGTGTGSGADSGARPSRRRGFGSRLATKGGVVLLGILAAALVVVGANPVWLTGRAGDAVLGGAEVSAAGGVAAPGVVALGLLLAAGALAVATTGRVARVVALVALGAASVGGVALTLCAVLDPGAVLGPVAAAAVGRTGSVPVDGASVSGWPWVTLAGFVLGACVTVLAARGRRRWAGLSTRYDAPGADGHATGARGERVTSDWDQLSAGEDPTRDPA